MKLLLQSVKILLAFALLSGFAVSCASHPDEDQIKALEETKAAALSAEQTLAQKKQQSADLEAKLEAKKVELEKVKKEKELVLKRLADKKAAEAAMKK
jgi:septal ring factor EnvC (AmiA/AmiB activator)